MNGLECACDTGVVSISNNYTISFPSTSQEIPKSTTTPPEQNLTTKRLQGFAMTAGERSVNTRA
jgi:hypothetical protein